MQLLLCRIQKEVDAHGRAMDSAHAAGWMESQAGGKMLKQGAEQPGSGIGDGIALDANHDAMDVELPKRFEVPRDGPWKARCELLWESLVALDVNHTTVSSFQLLNVRGRMRQDGRSTYVFFCHYA